MSRSRIECRDYANESGSNTQPFLGSLSSSKVKYLVLDCQEPEITQKFNKRSYVLGLENFFGCDLLIIETFLFSDYLNADI